MMALALSEDSIRLRARRNEVINALGMLPEHVREVMAPVIQDCLQPLVCSQPCKHAYFHLVVIPDVCLLMVLTGLQGMRGAKLVDLG